MRVLSCFIDSLPPNQYFHPNEVLMPSSFRLALTGGLLSKLSYRFTLQYRSLTNWTRKFESSPMRTRPESVRLGQTSRREFILRVLKRKVEKFRPSNESALVTMRLPSVEAYRSWLPAAPANTDSEVRLV